MSDDLMICDMVVDETKSLNGELAERIDDKCLAVADEKKPKTSIPTLIIVQDGINVDDVINSLKNKTYELIIPGLPSNILEIIYNDDDDVSRCRTCKSSMRNQTLWKAKKNINGSKTKPDIDPIDVGEVVFNPTASDANLMKKGLNSREKNRELLKKKRRRDIISNNKATGRHHSDIEWKSAGTDDSSYISGSPEPFDDDNKLPHGKKACPVCHKVYSAKYISEHKKTHSTAKPFKCDVCSKTFKQKDSLKKHQAFHSQKDLVSCEFCEKVFSSKNTLIAHVNRIHTEDSKKFQCTDCEKKFFNRHELESHKHQHQGGFKCKYCDSVYMNEASYKNHIRRHTGQLSYSDLKNKCNECGYIAKSPKILNDHKLLHSGEKPHQCDICGARFRLATQMRKHAYCHSDVKRYKCDECGESFKTKLAIQDHKDRHKGVKRHVCQYCGQQFFAKSNMFKHIKRIHSDDKSFECASCDKRFVTKQELNQHIRCHRNHNITETMADSNYSQMTSQVATADSFVPTFDPHRNLMDNLQQNYGFDHFSLNYQNVIK